ncbi:MAG: YraN family protein, partial [Acidimicrobiales bacterium]
MTHGRAGCGVQRPGCSSNGGGRADPPGAGRRRRSTAAPSDSAQLGAFGEERAARWYEDRGYEVLERNWRRREGELDLVV